MTGAHSNEHLAHGAAVALEPIGLVEKEAFRSRFYRYLAELARYDPKPQPPEEYPWFDLYWQSPARFPLYITCDRQVTGFALLRHLQAADQLIPSAGYELCEFAIDPEYRAQGIGSKAMLLVGQGCASARFPLYWYCYQENPATRFYDRYLAEVITGGWRAEKEQIRLFGGQCYRYRVEPPASITERRAD